ncbi:MAG: hypothetical protein JWN37_544 [Candidatus Nomurabacteria bacterium]|nr:hypothetical protein [Candidatus Nomurabacteria bacterium]
MKGSSNSNVVDRPACYTRVFYFSTLQIIIKLYIFDNIASTLYPTHEHPLDTDRRTPMKIHGDIVLATQADLMPTESDALPTHITWECLSVGVRIAALARHGWAQVTTGGRTNAVYKPRHFERLSFTEIDGMIRNVVKYARTPEEADQLVGDCFIEEVFPKNLIWGCEEQGEGFSTLLMLDYEREPYITVVVNRIKRSY